MAHLERSAEEMKCLSFIFAVLVASAAAAPVDWRLQQAHAAGPDNDMLLVETSLSVRWEGDSPLEFIAWTNTVDVGIEVRDEEGKRLQGIITTGPAPAFQKNVVLRRGESRTFDVFTGTFVLTRSGTYTATGQLKGESPQGKAITLDLGKIIFTVSKPARKEPNQSSQPTSLTRRG